MAKLTLNDITSGYATVAALNANNTAIEAALENTLSRDGTTPNSMQADFDMNGFNILNQGNPVTMNGFNWEGEWLTGTTYQVGDVVQEAGAAYICIVEHTAGTFATDLAAAKWQLVVQANLPAQAGNAAKFLQTDGNNPSWQVPDASEVSFTQEGTGADATTAQEKLRQTVSVFDFLPADQIAYIKLQDAGIASQDATIVTAGIQAALDTGYDVFLPKGLYLINSTLSMTVDGQIFYGEGRYSVLYKKAGVHFTAMVRWEHNPYPTSIRQRMHLRDMLIYTPETTTTTGIRVFSAEHSYITDVTVTGAFAYGVFNDYSTLLYLTRVSLWTCQVGFRGDWGHTGVGSWIYLTDCFISGCGGGIWIEDTAGVSINHCIVVGCTDFGIWIDRTAGKAAYTVDGVHIHNCDVDSNLDNGIRLTDLDRAIVSDTWVSSGRDATDYKDGIYANLCNELVVSNCSLYNNGAAGLHLDACTDSVVVGNKATGNKTYGIWANAVTSGTTFIGNTCSPAGPLYTQPTGIAVDNGDYNILVANNSQGHATNNIYDASGTNGKRLANIGVVDRNIPAVTVANLPTVASVGQGTRHMVSDATVTTFASIVAGGGANIVPVYNDGTDWRIG